MSGNMLDELKNLAAEKEIKTDVAMRLLLVATAELQEYIHDARQERITMRKDIDELSTKLAMMQSSVDNRFNDVESKIDQILAIISKSGSDTRKTIEQVEARLTSDLNEHIDDNHSISNSVKSNPMFVIGEHLKRNPKLVKLGIVGLALFILFVNTWFISGVRLKVWKPLFDLLGLDWLNWLLF